jgi:hypothetical protein
MNNDPFRNLPSQSSGCGGDPSFAVGRASGQVLPDIAPLLNAERKPGLVPAFARRLLGALPALLTIQRREG